MFCCCRPPATQEGQPAAGWGQGKGPAPSTSGQAAGDKPRPDAGSQQGKQGPPEPLTWLGEGEAQQQHPATSPPGQHSGSSTPHQHHHHHHQHEHSRGSEGGGGGVVQQDPQSDVLQLVALLQELLALSTASPKQPLSKAMGLLVVRLPVDWACLHVFSSSGRVVLQVGAALSPEAQRQRGASGSAAYATPGGSTPVRQRTSFNNMLSITSSSGSGSTAGAQGSAAAGGAGVQEVGAGHVTLLPGSGSSLERVCGSRQALALYAGDEAEAEALPPDWQRLYADRDLRSFLVVPVIASGSAGSIIGTLSFGLTSINDWGAAWWMSSIQLLCGWAAGALPQHRATARAAFFDALWSASDLTDVGRVFVSQLPSAMADQAQHKLEARLALVSSRLASCVMFAGQPATSSSSSRPSQEQQQAQRTPQQEQQLAAQQAQQQAGSDRQQAQQQQQQLQQQSLQHPQQQHQQRHSSSSAADAPQPSPRRRSHSSSAAGSTGVSPSPTGGSSSLKGSSGQKHSHSHSQPQKSSAPAQPSQQQQQQPAAPPLMLSSSLEPVSRFTLPTSNSVLLSALEWGEVMVVKDTVTYLGRNAAGGSGGVRDLFLPDRPLVRGTLVLLPLVFRCRALGCVYLLAPWDIHAELGKVALQEMAALLASGTFRALLQGGAVQAEWYSEVLSEGPMPSVPEADSSSSQATLPYLTTATAAPAAAQPSAAAAAPSATAVDELRGSAEGVLLTGSCDSIEASGASASGTASGTAGTSSGAPPTGLWSSGSTTEPCALPLSTAEAAAAAAAASSSAAAAAAAIAPVGLPVSGHAGPGFTDLVLWPELLDIKADLARSRHTAVYTAEYAGTPLALKLFRYSTAMEYSSTHAAAGGGAAGAGVGSLLGHHGTSSSSGGNVASEVELEAVLGLQYRLCDLSHTHLLQHVAVYPRVFEVVQRRSSREPPDVYLSAVPPRKERHHRCAAVLTEHAAGGCLRDAVNRGQTLVPTAAALQAAAAALGWPLPVDLAACISQQLSELVGQVLLQPPPQPSSSSVRTSQEHHTPAAGGTGSGPLVRLQQQPSSFVSGPVSAPLVPHPPTGRHSSEASQLGEPSLPLLHTLLLHIALGMQHLHSHGIIHGELRLDNVMITGALPSTASLVQQQLHLQQHQEHQQQSQAAAAAAGAAAAHVEAGGGTMAHAASSSLSTSGATEGLQDSSSSSIKPPGGLASSTVASGAAGSAQPHAAAAADGSSSDDTGFVLKLKDVGMCTLGFSKRQCTLRKLAGRPRLQAVSWLAPECFRGEGLSKHSDVYAFGILMWELYSGQVAFNDLVTSNTKVLQTIISDGVRPQFPDSAPAWYVTLANRCWAGAPKSRPSFRRIVQALQGLDDSNTAAAAAAARGGAAGQT